VRERVRKRIIEHDIRPVEARRRRFFDREPDLNVERRQAGRPGRRFDETAIQPDERSGRTRIAGAYEWRDDEEDPNEQENANPQIAKRQAANRHRVRASGPL
jgi:hypothetical protein